MTTQGGVIATDLHLTHGTLSIHHKGQQAQVQGKHINNKTAFFEKLSPAVCLQD